MRHSINAAKTAQYKTALGFNIHFIAFLLAIPVSFVTWYLTDTTYPWPLWSTAAWTIGIVFHYLGVFVFKRKQFKNN